MSWILKGLSGPLKGKKFPLHLGFTLGREGDLRIPDSRASSIHARIGQTHDGEWTIEDNGSKNGIRVDGNRIDTRVLTAGLIFHIGSFAFEVVEIIEKPKAQEPPAAPPPPTQSQDENSDRTSVILRPEEEEPWIAVAPVVKEDAASAPIIHAASPEPELKVTSAPKSRKWNEILISFLKDSANAIEEHPNSILPLEPAISLEFVGGVQVNSSWVIGYGPRKLGSKCLDLPIWEPGAPAVCFELVPSEAGVIFLTSHPEIVLLNGMSINKQVLKVGDTIRIMETLIEVGLIS